MAVAHSLKEAERVARNVGYPVVIRPSFSLGGMAAEVVHSATELISYLSRAVVVSNDSPVLIHHHYGP